MLFAHIQNKRISPYLTCFNCDKEIRQGGVVLMLARDEGETQDATPLFCHDTCAKLVESIHPSPAGAYWSRCSVTEYLRVLLLNTNHDLMPVDVKKPRRNPHLTKK